jgi:hypothetical protein
MAASKTLTPQQRIERASKAGKASHTPDAYIRQLADVAGDLTDEQARKLVAVLNVWAAPASVDQPLDAA